MKRIIILAAALALWAQSAQAQQWQPTTWPPAPLPGCETYVPMPAGTPDICGTTAELRIAIAALDYAIANQQAIGYGVDVPVALDPAVEYAKRRSQQWNRQTGRYDNEAWMWQPAPQNQQQWEQRRWQGGQR